MATPIPENHAEFEANEIVSVTGGSLRVPFEGRARGVAIDSRAVVAGNLFVALRGPTHDAHRFLPQVRERGALAAIVARGAEVPEGLGAVEVDDPERALGDLAAFHRLRWAGTVVGITGSAGKTTTKELVAAALEVDGARVHRTRGNLNNLIGVPMTLFELDENVSRCVLEMGTSRPGEIARLASIGASDVAVVTLASAAHTEGIGSVEKVAEEKTSLLCALRDDGTAIFNGDVEAIRPFVPQIRASRVLSFGREPENDLRLRSWELTGDLRTRAVVDLPGTEGLELRLRLLGEAAALNATTALAVVYALGLDLADAAHRIEAVEATEGRMRPLPGARGSIVLDDAYNANPRSTILALDTLAAVARLRGGRPVAYLADMRELGEREASDHRDVVAHAIALGISELVLVGGAMSEAARSLGSPAAITCVANADEAAELARVRVRSGDVSLVKGSRSLAMERVVVALHEEGAS